MEKVGEIAVMSLNKLVLVAVLVGTPVIAQADNAEPHFEFKLGGSFYAVGSSATIESNRTDNNASIDFEDVLSVESDVNIAGFSADWQISRKHRIGLNYVPIRREGRATITENVDYEDTTIIAGADVRTEFNNTIYDFDYTYSVYVNDKFDVGLTAGIYWLSTELELQASGSIEDENGQIEFDEDYRGDSSFDAPLPLFGVKADYDITDNWDVTVGLRYFALEIEDYSGEIISFRFSTDYYFSDHIGVGLGLGNFDLNVDAEAEDFRGNLNWNNTSAFVYLAARF